MRRFLSVLLCVLVLWSLSVTGCGLLRDPHIPDGYTRAEEHRDKDGFQDYTDFCVYYYDTADALETDAAYTVVTEADVERLKGYFSDFEQWMEVEDRLDEYTFDENCISVGDRCFVRTKEGQPIGDSVYGKYDDYTVYFFDTDSNSLFYIHNNI